jgi:hypothetical protein
MEPRLPPAPFSIYDTLCCRSYHDRDELHRVLLQVDLSEIEQQIILSRYIHVIEHIQKRVRMYSRFFYSGHIIITVGSLLVPALMSIQNSNSMGSTTIYWAAFIISLQVTACNALMALFKIDKKYYFLTTTLERLRSEGWQYLGLTGRYAGHLQGIDRPTHRNQFLFFTHQIEKIKMKQVEEEYYKSDEKQAHAPNGTLISKGNELYPPSPEQPIATMMVDIPDPVKDAVHSLIQSQKTIESTNIVIDPPIYHARL